jgi:CDP-diacylglycerol---glycerol-3-phosphate 3-phosphatidyltransferase
VIPASRGGKLKTLFQMGGIVLFLLPLDADLPIVWVTRDAVMGMAVVLTVLSGLDYVDKAYRTRSDSKAAKAARERARAGRLRRGASGSGGDRPEGGA